MKPKKIRIAWSCGVKPFHEHRYVWSAKAHIWLSQRLPQAKAKPEVQKNATRKEWQNHGE